MGANVFANGMEISGKANGNRSICAMPDVCLSPPSPPAGPVPIPYPNTAMASDTEQGSKKVKIGGKEVGLKNESDYKKSTGDEAATKSFGMGVVSHTIQGKMKHAAWSFDVKFEGSNVIRHMDLTTHNHMNPTNGALTLDTGQMFMAIEGPKSCEELQNDNDEAKKNPPPSANQLKERTTLTTAQYQAPDGRTFSMKAFSRKMPGKKGWAQGVGKFKAGPNKGKEKPSNLCAKADFEYARTDHMPHSSHTEARLIEDVFKAQGKRPGGTLTMRIQWNQGDGVTSDQPCGACKNLICAAQECGLTIKLCEDGGPPDGSKPDCPS